MKVRTIRSLLTGSTLFITLLTACAPLAAPEKGVETVQVESLATTTLQPAGEVMVFTATPVVITEGEHPPVTEPKLEESADSIQLLTPIVQATRQPTEQPIIAPSHTAMPPSLVHPTLTSTIKEQVLAEPLEQRLVELEWPDRMRLGESDVVRLSLVPVDQGLAVKVDFPDHQVITQTVPIRRTGGYELYSVARLDGVGFNISPDNEQIQYLPLSQVVHWRWSIQPRTSGFHRLAVTITLRWVPYEEGRLIREVAIFTTGMDVRVSSILGLTQPQAMLTGLLGLVFAGSLSALAFSRRPNRISTVVAIEEQAPNPELVIELPSGLALSLSETSIMQSLFNRYSRLVIEQEFLSGYSGARTFLALPIKPDGRADAYTIAKLGEVSTIEKEYANYETFVKDTLPPITARIQHPPVVVPQSPSRKPTKVFTPYRLAGLQYTFIGEPGATPVSLRQVLLAKPNPDLLYKLIDTFGPNWWFQRQPHTFRMAQEYDRVLPTHLVLEPADSPGLQLDGSSIPGQLNLKIGDKVTLTKFPHREIRSDGASLSLLGHTTSGQPALRVRWLSTASPENATGRVVATRQTLLRQYCSDCDLLGLPDPIQRLPSLLDETVRGSTSTIHGDLNLENILVGPGNLVWLIDFAQTREGHNLYDFAHLEAEIIAHILAPNIQKPAEYLALLEDPLSSPYSQLYELIKAMHEIAGRCLLNPSHSREYRLALLVTCLGALKFTNLDLHAKHLLFLTAAYLNTKI